nr:hypothetical protein [Mesorhizobium sp. WSM3866]
MKQRVGLARAMAAEILLLDEPFSALGRQLQQQFLDLAKGGNAGRYRHRAQGPLCR